jgi:hypothetical protein
MYNRYVVFKEVRDNSESEVVQIEKNPEKLRFELSNEEEDSDESTESDEEVENLTLVVRRSERVGKLVRRYIPPHFCFTFVLTSTENEPKYVREVVDLEKGRLWKDTMVEDMESLQNNETWDLVELPSRRKIVGIKCVFKKNMNTTGQVEKFKT